MVASSKATIVPIIIKPIINLKHQLQHGMKVVRMRIGEIEKIINPFFQCLILLKHMSQVCLSLTDLEKLKHRLYHAGDRDYKWKNNGASACQ